MINYALHKLKFNYIIIAKAKIFMSKLFLHLKLIKFAPLIPTNPPHLQMFLNLYISFILPFNFNKLEFFNSSYELNASLYPS